MDYTVQGPWRTLFLLAHSQPFTHPFAGGNRRAGQSPLNFEAAVTANAQRAFQSTILESRTLKVLPTAQSVRRADPAYVGYITHRWPATAQHMM
jgi:hypothetical protein